MDRKRIIGLELATTSLGLIGKRLSLHVRNFLPAA